MKNKDLLQTFFNYINNGKKKKLDYFSKTWKPSDDLLIWVSSNSKEEFKLLTADKDLFPFELIKKEVEEKGLLTGFFENKLNNLKFLVFADEKTGSVTIVSSSNRFNPEFITFFVLQALMAFSNS